MKLEMRDKRANIFHAFTQWRHLDGKNTETVKKVGAEPPLHVTNAADAPTPDLVQEALPETLALKHRALAALEPLIAPDAPIASSSSGDI